MTEEWFWEGNVVEAICKHLMADGWSIESRANTETHEAGIDILAHKANKRLIVEVKGYPSEANQRGKYKGQPNRQRGTQARIWFGDVLLSAILRQDAYPDAEIAIAFPDFRTYSALLQ